MSIISIPFTFTVGAVIVASQHNSNFSTIYNDYNGNITTANLAANAAIADTQLAQISTAGKISGASLTLLGSIPSGGGTIPAKNGGTGSDMSAAAQGAVPYFSATAVMSALGVGTSGQVLSTQGASANPQWINNLSSILDYGTSGSVSTAKTAPNLKIAYGTLSVSGNSTGTITNLVFTSSSTFSATCSFNDSTQVSEDCGILRDSGAQCTIRNSQASTRAIAWIAIGT